ncbi:hypothetical protein IE53DRAFT_160547 [Violaceomyces palustris]|uniref:Uncharacterized protein n=1 Tax=Violaceomyces palustris TaxID=1673888 RepID=A0ACD0NTN3_9BASI|nr:hypothetical protein IE53DRAFT_160547 [Violaceomyces palustris]
MFGFSSLTSPPLFFFVLSVSHTSFRPRSPMTAQRKPDHGWWARGRRDGCWLQRLRCTPSCSRSCCPLRQGNGVHHARTPLSLECLPTRDPHSPFRPSPGPSVLPWPDGGVSRTERRERISASRILPCNPPEALPDQASLSCSKRFKIRIDFVSQPCGIGRLVRGKRGRVSKYEPAKE